MRPPADRPPRRPVPGLVLLAALAVLGPAAHAAGPAPALDPFDQAGAEAAASRIDADPGLADARAACPADLFGRLSPALGSDQASLRVQQDVCAAQPGQCLDQCLSGSSAGHCMSLALAMEAHQPPMAPRTAAMLFARGCALGDASGCTNRASGISYHHLPDDPLMRQPDAGRERCEFRTYEASCAGGDVWGCSMLGNAYRTGAGTAADPGAARRHYEEACRRAPGFAACDNARDGLAQLGGAGR